MEKNMEETWMFYMGEYREFGGQHKHRYHVQVWLGYPIQKYTRTLGTMTLRVIQDSIL